MRAALLVVALTLASYPLGLALGQAWLLPLLNTAPAYLTMLWQLRRGRRAVALRLMLIWAATLGAGGTCVFALWPADPGALVLNGPAYRDEMLHWIRSGVGREGDWRLFLPQHLGHLLAFVALSLASASALSMVLGAVLMNFMSYYVATLARAGVPAATVVLWGWQPWALCRVAAFVTLGVLLAEPLGVPECWRGSDRRRAWWRGAPLWWAAAAAGILGDWLLKAWLAPHWRRVLQAALP